MKEKIQKWLGIIPPEEIKEIAQNKVKSMVDKRLEKFRRSEKARYGHIQKQITDLQQLKDN